MRTFKFRAWDKINKKMLDPISVWSMGSDLGGEVWGNLWVNKENLELMQFTGLLDKNGKEIYEGDILRGFRYTRKWRDRPATTVEMIFEVTWDEEFSAFRIYYKKMGWKSIIGGIDAPYEVIGNIYENPELL